jgi:surface carbohydrate biosynthesis protein
MKDIANTRPWLLIPIEVKVREFHGKLLLGAVAAESGFNVLIGEQIELRSKLRFLPHGIILEKGVTPHQLADLLQSRKVGNRVVAWCEEGLVYRNREAYLRARVSLEAMALVDRFFAWGKVQTEDVLTKADGAREKLVLTGNPRFDLLRPELRGLFRKQADELRRTHGPYILVSTNFSRVNHFRGRDYQRKILQARGAQDSPKIAEFNRGWTEFLHHVYVAFLDMLPELAVAFPHVAIIVRPHPAESLETWRRASARSPNIRVIHEGTIIPWSLAAEAVVHNSCTTGVESYLLDVPVVSYQPVTSEIYDSKLPNAISHPTFTAEELIATVEAIIGGGAAAGFTPEEAQRRQAIAHQYITGIDGPWASDRIVEAIKEIPVTPFKNRISTINRISMAVTDGILKLRTSISQARGRLIVNPAHRRLKFPGLELTEVRQTLTDLREISGRFQDIQAKTLSGLKNGFCLFSR